MPGADQKGATLDESHGQTARGGLRPEQIEALDLKYFSRTPLAVPGSSPLPGMQNQPIGVQSRLGAIFPGGNTVMLACDHNYLIGDRLPRLDQLIVKAGLLEGLDCLMCTRGARTNVIPANFAKPVCIRVGASPGLSILGRRDLPDIVTDRMMASGRDAAIAEIRKKHSGVQGEDKGALIEQEIAGIDQPTIERHLKRILADRDLPDEIETIGEWVLKLNVSMLAVQVYPGSPHYADNLRTLQRVIDFGTRFDIPVMAVTGVGANMVRDGDFFRSAIATIVTMGPQVIKTYYTEDAEYTVLSAGIPLVMAGGSTTSELATLESVEKWMQKGGRGVDMGRNIIEAKNPRAMMDAVRTIVHEGKTAEVAHAVYQQTLKEH